MVAPLIIIGIIAVASIGLLSIYFIDETTRNVVNGLIYFIMIFIDTIPQIFNFITIIGGYIFGMIGFFLSYLPIVFAVIQVIFMATAIEKRKAFDVIKKYIDLNKQFFSFLIHLFEMFIRLIVAIANAIGNYIPLT